MDLTLTLYFVGAVVSYVVYVRMKTVLDQKYLKPQYVSNGFWRGMNFYQHLFAIFTPKHYLKEGNFSDAYSYFMIYTLVGLILGICGTMVLIKVIP